MSDDQLLEQLTDGELVYLNAQACHAGDCQHPSCHDYRRAVHAELYPQCSGTEDNLASHNGHDDPEAHEEIGTRAWV